MPCPEATFTLILVWKWGDSKQGILKSLVSHVLNFKRWIKLIYDTVDVCNFVMNEFNSTFEVQDMGNKAFQNASFWDGRLVSKWEQTQVTRSASHDWEILV